MAEHPWIQLAADCETIDELVFAANVTARARLDYFEIGTPTLHRSGYSAIDCVRPLLASTRLYVDTKLVDFPELELPPLHERGAHAASCLIGADNEVVSRSVEVAEAIGLRLIFSTMGYPEVLLTERVREVQQIGGRCFIAHGSGANRSTAFAHCMRRLQAIRQVDGVEVVIAGGIGLDNIDSVLQSRPEGLIIGRGVLSTEDPDETIALILQRVQSWRETR